MKRTFLSFVIDQWTTLPPVEQADLSGKTVVVVGGNTGIGFETAKHFARMNPAKLIVACRNESKGKDAVSEITLTTGFNSCALWLVDLADFASVTRFAERFNKECDNLDLLVMNAGIAISEYNETVDGWESSLQVNHLGTALLSLLLLPRLIDTGKKFRTTSRLVVVSSEVHYWSYLPDEVEGSSGPLAILNSPKYRDPSFLRRRYIETKLLNVFFVRALQEHMPNTPLSVNTVNPGFCYSNLRRNLRGLLPTIFNFVLETCLARTAEGGSRQLVYAAIGARDNEDHMKGAFISNAEVVEPSDFVISRKGEVMQNNVWTETIEILTKKAPQLQSIVQEYLT